MKARILAALFVAMTGLVGCIKGHNDFLYTTGPGTNEVFGFKLHGDGTLTALGAPNFATGSQPVSMAIHAPGDFIYIANFAGNNVTQLAINTSNGELEIPPTNAAIPPVTPPNIFNTGTGPVSVLVSPTAPHVYVLNQTSGDISAFLLDPGSGSLAVITNPPTGNPNPRLTYGTLTAPKAMTISPNGNFLFVASPAAGTVSVFAVNNGDGSLAEVAGSPFAVGGTGATPNWVTVEPSGRFLYVADSAHNVVLGLSIGSSGALAPITGSPFTAGLNPTFVAVDPTGVLLFASNTNESSVSAYVIDAGSGALGPVAGSPFATGGKNPGFLLATAAHLFVVDQATNDIAAFAIGKNGVLSRAKGSPFAVPVSAQWISVVSE